MAMIIFCGRPSLNCLPYSTSPGDCKQLVREVVHSDSIALRGSWEHSFTLMSVYLTIFLILSMNPLLFR